MRCLAALGGRLWVGLADGHIRVLAEKPGSPGVLTIEEDWLAHEVSMPFITSCSCQTAVMGVDHQQETLFG